MQELKALQEQLHTAQQAAGSPGNAMEELATAKKQLQFAENAAAEQAAQHAAKVQVRHSYPNSSQE